MYRLTAVLLAFGCVLATSCSRRTPPAPVMTTIALAKLQDKIKGGWAGQMIGVSYGAPTEFRYLGRIIPEDELPEWKPGMVQNSLRQDDVYVDMTFAGVLDKKGLNATTKDFGAMFARSRYRLWHANMVGRRNLRHGIPANESGLPKNNVHANDIDFQIEADFIGLMTPGMPRVSNNFCWRAGRVMNYGDGIYGGMFISGMYAAAFFESNPRQLVEAGLACLPPQSPYAKIITDTLAWSKQYPDDWTKVWRLIEDKWDKRDPCPSGALRPFNIDAKLNGAYVALGLLYGGGEFGKTIRIATRCGQDSDCNPASAGGVMGVVLGYHGIPEKWKSGIPAIADKKFSYTDYTFQTIVESTTQRAVTLAQRYGGKFMGDSVVVRRQQPRAATFESWDDYGSPAERIEGGDARWSWKGRWQTRRVKGSEANAVQHRSSSKGAEATVSFEGTGFILTGAYMPTGGKLDVSLDQEPAKTVDVYLEAESPRGGESVYHRFGLVNGKHTLRLVVLGKPYEGNTASKKGREVEIDDLIVFR